MADYVDPTSKMTLRPEFTFLSCDVVTKPPVDPFLSSGSYCMAKEMGNLILTTQSYALPPRDNYHYVLCITTT